MCHDPGARPTGVFFGSTLSHSTRFCYNAKNTIFPIHTHFRMLQDNSAPPAHDAHASPVTCLVPQHDAPRAASKRKPLRMTLSLFAATALPALLLTSSLPRQFAVRPDAMPGMHGAAPASVRGQTADSSRIEGLREARRAKYPGAVPLKPAAPAAPEIPAKPDNKTGVYLTITSAQNEQKLRDTIQALVDRGETALVIDVKGGRVHYASQAPLANELGLVSPYLDLDKALAIAKEHGLYTIARFVALKDDGLPAKLPDTMVKNPKTGARLSPGWTDPANPTVIEYNTQVMCELAEKGFDEINLDYIRFSTADFGNLRVYSGAEKADRLEAFIKASKETIARCNPETKLGISTFAIIGWNYDVNVATLGQDIVRLAPHVDIISPMAYPATFTSEGYYVQGKHPRSRMYWLVYRTLTGYAEFLGEQKTKLRPWIQGYYVSAKDMREQMDAVTDAGLCGFQVWNANNNYAPTYQAMSDWSLPEHCK